MLSTMTMDSTQERSERDVMVRRGGREGGREGGKLNLEGRQNLNREKWI